MIRHNKKGAIELSMTTIIVIVMGVTLLSLGIIWVRNTMEKVTGLSDTAFATAQQELQERMGSNDAFYVKGNYFKVKRGDTVDITAGIQNTLDTQQTFTISKTVLGVTGVSVPTIEIIYSKNSPNGLTLDPNEKAPAIVRVKIPDSIAIGSKPVVNLELSGGNINTEPKQVTLEITT